MVTATRQRHFEVGWSDGVKRRCHLNIPTVGVGKSNTEQIAASSRIDGARDLNTGNHDVDLMSGPNGSVGGVAQGGLIKLPKIETLGAGRVQRTSMIGATGIQ